VEDEIRHALLRALYAYWDDRRGGRIMPARSDLDPVDIPDLLRHLILLDVTHDPLRFRVRLYGTEIAERAGRDPTGKTFDELYAGVYLETAKQTYEDILVSRAPHFSQRVFPIGDGTSELRYDRLILPFAKDGQTIDSFLLCIVVVSQGGTMKVEGSFRRYT
jgi:hypothetical protein